MIPELRSYFSELRESLHLEPAAADDVLRELQTHVEDCLEELRQTGEGEEGAGMMLRRNLGRPQVLARLLREAHTQVSWLDALLAVTPFLMAATLFATHLWHTPVGLAAFGLLVVSVTLGAYWRGKPSWFYTWAGMALTILVVCGYLAFLILQGHASDLVGGTKNPIILLGVSGAAVYFPLAVLVLLWCTQVVVRRDWILASLMLSPMPAVTLWLASIHQAGGVLAPDWSRAAGYDDLLARAFIGMAIAAAAIMRAQSRTTRVATLVGSALLIVAATSGASGPGSLLTAAGGQGMLILGFLLIPAVIDGLMGADLGQLFNQDSRPGSPG